MKRNNSKPPPHFIGKFVVIFSVEAVLSVAIFILLPHIPALENWFFPTYTFEVFDVVRGEVFQVERQNSGLALVRFLGTFMAVWVAVFGIGELVRRKLNRKSLFFSKKDKPRK